MQSGEHPSAEMMNENLTIELIARYYFLINYS